MARIGVLNEVMERRRNAEPALRESMSSCPRTLESGHRAVPGDERDYDGDNNGDGEGPADHWRRQRIGGGRAVAGSGVVARVGRDGVGENIGRQSDHGSGRRGCHDCRVAGARGEGAG